MKLLVKLFLLILTVLYLPKLCYGPTAGFTIGRIHSDFSFRPEWEVKNPPLPKIFDQSFTYLGSGGQCYAFASQDGNYVLKFFKQHQRRVPFLLKIAPLPVKWAEKREKQRKKRLWKLERDFRSYKIALETLPEESAVLYVHLNKTSYLHQKARIVDKIGIEHQIDLDGVEFILQKRATLAYTHLFNLIEDQNLEGAKEALRSICKLILDRSTKGIYDEDPNIHRNMGFIGDKAILIDVGRLKPDMRNADRSNPKEDLIKITNRLKKDLLEVSPELADYLETYVNHDALD